MAKGPTVAPSVAPKVRAAYISNRSVDVEGPHHRTIWIVRWIFFSAVLVVGLFLVLGEMGQKLEHKKFGDALNGSQSSAD